MLTRTLTVLALLLLATPAALAQGPSAEELARANNPLAEIKAFNLQNYYAPKLNELPDATSNAFWLRYARPTGRVLWRASLPLRTLAVPGQTVSGVGDFDVFGAYLAVQEPDVTFGIGPSLVIPTSGHDELGTGKWQLGLASVVFAVPSPKLQYGGLITWSASVGGDEDRPDTSVLATQWFGFWQLGGGNYLRMAPIWAFDLKSGHFSVPFGLGIGRVTKVDDIVFNIFIEPQYTILVEGPGQPMFQVFVGLNMQFN